MQIKSMIIVAITLISFAGVAMTYSKIDVPQAVKTSFSQKYPAAQKVEWEMEESGEYEAEFKLNRKEMSANFKADGTWMESEVEMKKADTPPLIKEAIANQFPGYELEGIEQIETPDLVLGYEVELENDETDEELEVIFAVDGTVVQKEIEQEDEDDGQ